MPKRKKQGTDFGNITKAKDLAKFVKNSKYVDHYCHYTSIEFLDSILEKRCFRLSCVEIFNDSRDSEQFRGQNYCFTLCFTQRESEDLPLWAMYSKGLDCKGARITLTENLTRQLIENGSFELRFYIDKVEDVEKRIELKRTNKDMKCEFRDIVYYKNPNEKKKYMLFKHRGKINENITQNDHSLNIDRFRGFEKGFVWRYEKESRLLVQVTNNSIIEKIKEYEEYGYECWVVLSFAKIKKWMESFTITFGPGIDVVELENELVNRPYIAEFKEKKKERVKYSEYAGSVNIELCKSCKYKDAALAAGVT